MVLHDDVGIAGGVVAAIFAGAEEIAALQTYLVSLGAIRYGEIAEVIGRYRVVVAVIEFVGPLYLPLAWQEEELELMLHRLKGIGTRTMAIAIGRLFLDRQPTGRFHRESQGGTAITSVLATQSVASQQVVAVPRIATA